LADAGLLQLADIGYRTYHRVNAQWLDPDDCVNATKANCQEGLTLAHARAWRHIAESRDDGALAYLVLEDDVTFHSHFAKLFPRYAAEVRGFQTHCAKNLQRADASTAACGLHGGIRGPAQPRCAPGVASARLTSASDLGASIAQLCWTTTARPSR